MGLGLWVLLAIALVLVVAIVRSPALRPTGGHHLALAALVWSGMVAGALPESALRWAVVVLGAGAVIASAAVHLLGRGDALRRSPPSTGIAPVLACAIVVWTFVVDLLRNESAVQRVAAVGVSLLLVVAAVVLARAGGLSDQRSASVGVIGLTAILVHAAVTGSGWRPCHQDKCSVLGGLLAGPYSSENILGLFALFTLAAVISSWHGAHLVSGVAFCGSVIALTGSRTSLSAAGVLVGLLLLSRVLDGRGAPVAGGARALARAALLSVPVIVAVVGTLLIAFSDAQLLSGRGRIWLMASVVLEGRWFAGVGLSRWVELQGIGLLPSHFAHSQILVLLFSGGGVALALYAWMMTELLRRNTVDELRHAAPALALLLSGLTEAIWNPLTVDALTWATVAALVTARAVVTSHAVQVASSRPTPEARRLQGRRTC